jgi:sugar lactone lactonase YvrE
MAIDFQILHTPVTELGESPSWDAACDRLGYVDLTRGTLHVVDRAGRQLCDPADAGDELAAVVPLAGGQGWLAARASDIGIIDGRGRYERRAMVDLPAGVRLNDGKCDMHGRFWVGSMSRSLEPGLGALFRVDRDGSVTQMVEGLTLSNGLDWSPDGSTFYLVDTIPGLLFAWTFDADRGELHRRRLLSDDLGPGMPDGLAVDLEGRIWIACCGAGVVRVFDPRGRFIEEHPVPVSQPTCPSFAGHDGRTLMVTTATLTLSQDQLAEQPGAGRLLVASVEVGGPPARPAQLT